MEEASTDGGSEVREMRARIDALQSNLARTTRDLRDLDTVIDSVPVGICVADDPECRHIRFNREFSRIIGVPPNTNMSLTPPPGAFPPCVAMSGQRVIPGHELPMQVAARDRREVRDFEHDLVFADGRRFSLVVNAQPLFDDAGNVRGALAVCWDVTSRNEQARRLRDLAEHRDSLLREVNHRVKNKLQLLLSLFELELSSHPPEDAAAALLKMRDRVWAISLLHDTLGAGGEDGFIDARSYVRALVEQIGAAHGASQRGCTLSTDIVGLAIPVAVALKLGLIVNELIVNSLKHAFPEGRAGKIRVVAEAADHQLTLAVEDDGIGSSTDQPGRDGLGRKLVKSLAESLKATITTGGVGGTRVRLEIPLPENHLRPGFFA